MSGTDKKKKDLRKQSSFNSLAPMNQSFQENQQRLIVSLLFFFLSKTPAFDVSESLSLSRVVLEAEQGLWLNSESCPGAVLWGRNHGTTDNALQSTSLTTVIRFSLFKTLEKDRRSSFLQSKGHRTDVRLETIEVGSGRTLEGLQVSIFSSKGDTSDIVLTVGIVWTEFMDKTKASQCQAHN